MVCPIKGFDQGQKGQPASFPLGKFLARPGSYPISRGGVRRKKRIREKKKDAGKIPFLIYIFLLPPPPFFLVDSFFSFPVAPPPPFPSSSSSLMLVRGSMAFLQLGPCIPFIWKFFFPLSFFLSCWGAGFEGKKKMFEGL